MSETMNDLTAQPLVKTVVVTPEPARAFELFTDQIAQWWPLATHSVGEADAVDVEIQGRVGGQIVETLADGRTSVWGTVTTWDPPHHVAFTWHPGRLAAEATIVSVRFTPHDAGTQVQLTHSGWESRDDGNLARQGYDTGWDTVLGHFTSLAG